ncbi:hypothetical protein [Bacillus sp. E(2018)]|uniref:hypothetical protein n=1 Tax=Bacillus sp. E(2018) TaxID=2502239 RepID=UPI0010FA04B5|nr:hypothetical protein [Bacillus sp. E(2018)]
MDQFTVATSKDIAELNDLEIPFNFKNNISLELTEENLNRFRWILKRKDSRIVGFHRSFIVSGWGFLSGIFIQRDNTDQWLLPKLVNYAIKDLISNGCSGLIAWDDSPPSYKTDILKRYGFTEYPSCINRLFFNREGIEKLSFTSQQNAGWSISTERDVKNILLLAKRVSSYINLDNLKEVKESFWIVKYHEGNIVAAINYWVHGNTAEVHFSISENVSLDITGGIQALALKVSNIQRIQFLKINLEPERVLTLIRLTSFGACTYRNGYKNTCLIRALQKEQRRVEKCVSIKQL